MSKLRRENPHALKINQLKYRPSSPLKHYVTKIFPETFRNTYPLVHTDPSVQQSVHTFSAPKIHQFNTKDPSVQHTSQLNTFLSLTHPSVQHTLTFNKGFLVLNSGFVVLNRNVQVHKCFLLNERSLNEISE